MNTLNASRARAQIVQGFTQCFGFKNKTDIDFYKHVGNDVLTGGADGDTFAFHDSFGLDSSPASIETRLTK